MINERNHSIDSLKLVCALLVVFIHCKYPYRDVVIPLTDVAVPLFFCISGYFVSGRTQLETHKENCSYSFMGSGSLFSEDRNISNALNTPTLRTYSP